MMSGIKGNNLRSIRKQKNLTILQLSEKSKVNNGYISEIENGKKIPTIDVICKLAEALKCKPEDLYECDCKDET